MSTNNLPKIYFLDSYEILSRYISSSSFARLSSKYDFIFLARSSSHTPCFGDLVVTIQCASPGALLEVASLATRCPAICIVDGVVEWRNSYENPLFASSDFCLFHDSIFDYYLCSKNSSVESLAGLGIPVLTLEEFVTSSCLTNNIASYDTCLVTTARLPYFDSTEKSLLLAELPRICDYIVTSGRQLKLRIFDKDLLKSLSEYRCFNVINESFQSALATADLLFTTPSTVSLDAMAKGIPVIHIDVRDGPLLVQSGWRLTPNYSIEQIFSTLSSSTRLAFQRQQVYPDVSSYKILGHDNLNSQNLNYRKSLSLLRHSPFNWNFELFLKGALRRFRILSYLRSFLFRLYLSSRG